MQRVKENKISIILCDDDRYKRAYVSDFIEKDGYYSPEITCDLENQIATLAKNSKKILIDNTDASLLDTCVAAIKYLAESADFEGGTAILFTTARISSVLLELGTDLSDYKLYHLLYKELLEKDCNNYKALVELKSITARPRKWPFHKKGLVEVYATLLYGEIRAGDVLKDVYGGPLLEIIGDPVFYNKRCAYERVPCFNTVGENFTFYLNINEYGNVNPPKILMKL